MTNWGLRFTEIGELPMPEYTMEDFKNAAASIFANTTGQSPKVAHHYESLSKEFLVRPMTAENIGEFVAGENEAVLKDPSPSTPEDRLAMAATPMRGVVAHSIARTSQSEVEAISPTTNMRDQLYLNSLVEHLPNVRLFPEYRRSHR